MTDGGFVSAAPRAKWVVRFLIASVGIDAVALLSGLGHVSLLSQVVEGATLAPADRDASELRQASVAMLQLAVFVLTAALFLLWLSRAYGNLPTLGALPTYSRRAPVWSWFVPFLNLVRPFQIVRELWHLSDPATPAARDPRGALPTPAVVGWWWGIWLISSVLGQAVMRLSLRADTPQAVLNSAYLSLASDAIGVVAALFAISVVKEIDARQTVSQKRLGA